MQPTSLRYKFSLLALSPLALAHVVYRSFKDGGIDYFKQRLGLGYKNSQQKTIHFHCASVGEFLTAKPLILKIANTYPENIIIVTTNTPTAAKLIDQLNHPKIQHCYLPLDFAFSIKRFFKDISPLCSIILETEIWPNFYFHAAKNKTPISIINARLSEKTINTNKFIKSEFARALKNVNNIFARSIIDCDNYINLGAKPASVQLLGNLKYAISETDHKQLACTTIKRPFFLAASTHEDEEMQIAQHMELLRRNNYLLVIAPRYPDRCKQLATHFKKINLEVAVRSSHDDISQSTDIYIIDTLGELNMYFNEAALVFIGGSLIPRGGHNILEPANYGKCILVGPYTDNFSSEVSDLTENDAIIQVKDNHELGRQLIRLLKSDSQRENHGINAAQFMQKQIGVFDQYFMQLCTLINIHK